MRIVPGALAMLAILSACDDGSIGRARRASVIPDDDPCTLDELDAAGNTTHTPIPGCRVATISGRALTTQDGGCSDCRVAIHDVPADEARPRETIARFGSDGTFTALVGTFAQGETVRLRVDRDKTLSAYRAVTIDPNRPADVGDVTVVAPGEAVKID